MKNTFSEDHVLPRPVERLPDFANAKARQPLAEKIIQAFRLSSPAANAIANAVVDPSTVRKGIGEPDDPQVEEISVPGGTLLGIRTQVWAPRVMPDPRNPRTLPDRVHPFAVEPGSADNSRFRPVPEPRSPEGAAPEIAELTVDIESRDHLTWASQQAAAYVSANNDWKESIASQGVMEAVWLVPTTYLHADGSEPATVLTTAEGSSRMTASHSLLEVRSADVPYEDEGKLRTQIKKLNEAFDRGPDAKEQIALRCQRVPALILVGFRKHEDAKTSFPTAVKSLVALRHVDYPKPWGEGPENESLADEVLDELYRRDLISSAERAYFAGSSTRAEARAAHLSDNPAIRAARIVHLFTSEDERVKDAIRIAITSQSTRKRISQKLFNDLATALVLRATAEEPAKADLIRRCMRQSFGKAVHRGGWESTNKSVEKLVEEALNEVKMSIADESIAEPGPSTVELAVRAAYPLVVSRRLTADRNFGEPQADRRTPGEVLDAMRRTTHGVYQLGQALRDFGRDGQQIRAVDEDGEVKQRDDGSGEQTVSDPYLRAQFPAPGKARAPRSGDTPLDRYQNAINAFSKAMETLEQAFTNIGAVIGDDGWPVAESRGIDPRDCGAWRDVFRRVDEELIIWASTFKRKFGTAIEPSVRNVEEAGELDSDEEGDTDHGSGDGWKNSGKEEVDQLPA